MVKMTANPVPSKDAELLSNRLGVIVYGSDGAGGLHTTFASDNMGQGSGAVAWLIGDVNGGKKDEVVQLWNNNGRLGLIVYGSDGAGGLHTTFASDNMGQGSGAVAWLIGDVNGGKKDEVVQLWDNNGRLGLIVYGSDGAGGLHTTFASDNMGQGSSAVAWLIGDVNGGKKDEVVQLWNNA
jgi:hypothetical protein